MDHSLLEKCSWIWPFVKIQHLLHQVIGGLFFVMLTYPSVSVDYNDHVC